ELIGRYGGEAWFQIGDRDFATHIVRTQRLRAGEPLGAVTEALARALGIRARIVPMCDQPVTTLVDTPEGRLEFQEYFVHRDHADGVKGVAFAGIEAAIAPDSVRLTLAEAESIVFCPSNPIVSIGPILAVPGLRDRLRSAAAPRVGVSPIVGGKALRGPAD